MFNDTTFEDLKKDYTDLSIEKPSIISSTEREKMLLKTARSLPDNPSDSGMKASAVKPKFYSFATDTADSLYAYFNRAIWVINTAFDNVIEKLNTQFGDNKDQIDDILDAISSFKTSYLSYVEQMKTTITDINETITNINSDITDINVDLETKQTTIEANATNITTINGNIDTIETSISDLEESISTANGRIDSTIESINTTNTNLATTNSNLENTNINLSNEITNRENAINGLIGNASEGYKTLGQLQSKLLEAIDTLTTTISNHKNATGNVHTVYGSQVAMSDSNSKTITSALNDLANQIELLGGFDDQTSADFSSLTDRLSAVENHTSSTSNPHNVTKSQVGLGSVDNTSDINKPVSTAQASAIATAKSEANTYTDTLSNKLKYKLGAYDSVNGNVITRQTGYVDLGTLNWQSGSGYSNCFYATIDDKLASSLVLLNDKYTNLETRMYATTLQNNTSKDKCIVCDYPATSKIVIIKDTVYDNATTFKTAMSGVKLIYELATSYTENILSYSEESLYHNELLKVAKEQAQVFDIAQAQTVGYELLGSNGDIAANSDYTTTYYIPVKENTIYTSSGITDRFVAFYDTNKIFLSFKRDDSTYITPSGCAYVRHNFPNGDLLTFMLNEGSTPIPYQPYKGSLVHSSDLEAVKSELNQVVSTNTNNISSLQTSVSANTSSISTNTSSISSLQTSVQTNTNNIATNTSNISSLQTSVSAINGKLLTYIDCTLDDNDDISCTFDTSVITKENAQNYAVKMKVYNSDSEQHNYQYLYFDKLECYEPEGGGTIVHNIYYRNPNHAFLIERRINGSNATDVVAYENGYNVKKSIEAIYASSDHTKGTIEKRLTALGFKEGVMSLSGYTLTDSTAPNTVKKQGKYCIANLDVSMDSSKPYSITVPNDFKPKQATTFYAKASAYLYSQLTDYVIEVTIDTSGVINLTTFPNNYWSRIRIKNAGWELA